MITVTTDVILNPLVANGTVASVYLALRIKYATAISWASLTFPLLMFLTFRLYLQIIFIDRLID